VLGHTAERVEIQLAGKTTEITNKSSNDAERVEIQSAGKTTKITNKSSDDATRDDATRTNIHEADQATQNVEIGLLIYVLFLLSQ
jgi:hypothetical protein